MSDEKDLLGERGRSLEADYFRRKDKELLDRAREQQSALERRRQLAVALGIEDDAIVTALGAMGFEAGTAPLLDIVPAIQVAWADGTLPAKERAEIERLLARPEMEASARAGSRLVAEWLAREPGRELYRLATDTLRLRLARLEPEARTRLVSKILGDCNAVAAASGGVFGIGALSSVESERIRELAAALGVKP